MRLVVAVILALAFGVCSAGNGDSDGTSSPAWGVQQLMQGMAEVKSSRHKFTERKYMSVLTKPLETSGVLVYEAPGRLEKHTLTPKDESMVLNQGVIVIENKAKGMKRTMMVNQYPALGAFVESIRATLAGDLETLMHYYQIRLDGNAAHWHLQLIPNEQAAREMVREVSMEGRGKLITRIEILEANGDHSVMTVGEGAAADGEQQ